MHLFRHDIGKHKRHFRDVAVLTQLSIEHGINSTCQVKCWFLNFHIAALSYFYYHINCLFLQLFALSWLCICFFVLVLRRHFPKLPLLAKQTWMPNQASSPTFLRWRIWLNETKNTMTSSLKIYLEWRESENDEITVFPQLQLDAKHVCNFLESVTFCVWHSFP